jgi:hypothetical protein
MHIYRGLVVVDTILEQWLGLLINIYNLKSTSVFLTKKENIKVESSILNILTYLTILKRAWSANFKMVWYVLLRPLRPELDGQDSA